MSNQLRDILSQWYPRRDDAQWVVGTIYKTEGPCYRKAGAMMMFDGLGTQLGLLSGGCLESDIQRHARQVMQSGESQTLCYDGSDEDDISFQLGIGCGGTVHILLDVVERANHYRQLDHVYAALSQRTGGHYIQWIGNGNTLSSGDRLSAVFEADTQQGPHPLSQHSIATLDDDGRVVIPIIPEPYLLVVGGGLDAIPVASIAQQLGWGVTVCDPRPANGRRDQFGHGPVLLDALDATLTEHAIAQHVDAVIVMTHNVTMDAKALQLLKAIPSVKYLALLGPVTRKQQVLDYAALQPSDLSVTLSAPAGFDIGGELPESIALSMLSECHQMLYQP